MLQLKIRSAETFIPAAIISTDILSTSTDDKNHSVTVREILFREGFKPGDRRVKETCVEFPQMKVDFRQPDGTTIMNIVSQGAKDGDDLWMTYAFEWLHPELNAERLAERKQVEQKGAQKAVDGTIESMRELVKSGKF